MRRLREKLHSENGASILLALALFLMCCMVAASVLAAAVSNAGKIRSNRTEQQKYLTLSSAIRFVADGIQQAQYTWKYTVYEWEETNAGHKVSYFFCRQDEGTVSGGNLFSPAEVNISEVLPLEKMLGNLFSSEGYKALELKSDPDLMKADKSICDLLVTLPEDLEGYPYEETASPSDKKAYQVPDAVTVRVELNHVTRHITLTAWLGDEDEDPPADKSDTMVAELVAEAGTAPSMVYSNPENRTPGTVPAPYEDKEDAGKKIEVKDAEEHSGTTTWKLNWIKKGGS